MGDCKPVLDMEVEGGLAGKAAVGAGTTEALAASPPTEHNGHRLGARGGSTGGCSLLAKRKQLEDSGEEEEAERLSPPPPPLPPQQQQRQHTDGSTGVVAGAAVVAVAANGQGEQVQNGSGCLANGKRSLR